MATKLTDLAALSVTPTDVDLLTVVDVSDTTGGAAGTSKKITYANLMGAGSRLEFAKVSLSNADVLAMKYDNTPITLKAAESGKIIMPFTVVCVATHGGSDESSSDDLRIGWDAAASTTVNYWGAGRDWMNGISSDTISAALGGASATAASQMVTFSLTNKPFQIWCTDNFNGGWTMDVYFSFAVVDE